MSTPITRHKRELSNLAIVIAQQQDTIDGLLKYDKRLSEANGLLTAREEELTEERDTLLTENATLRTESNELEALIHRLCDDRARARKQLRWSVHISDLLGKQSTDFCQKYEVEEVRANTYRAERDDARRTIGLVRLECERLREDNEKLLRKLHTARGFGGKGVAKTKGKRK